MRCALLCGSVLAFSLAGAAFADPPKGLGATDAAGATAVNGPTALDDDSTLPGAPPPNVPTPAAPAPPATNGSSLPGVKAAHDLLHQELDRFGHPTGVKPKNSGTQQAARSERAVGNLGQVQNVWDKRSQQEDQAGLGVRRVHYDPNQTMVIHIRPAMATYVQLPSWEKMGPFIMGDKEVFSGQQIYSNSFMVSARDAGADTNAIVVGQSGLIYSFVFISDEVTGSRVPDLPVMVDASYPAALTGLPAGVVAYGSRSEWMWALDRRQPGFQKAGKSLASAMPPLAGKYLLASQADGDAPIRKEDLVFGDYEIKLREPEDDEIRPVRVFHDSRFTYFDFGKNRSDLARRPLVHLVTDEVDQPLDTRTVGSDQSILVAEAIGNFTLQHGRRVVCILYHGDGLGSEAARAADPVDREELYRRIQAGQGEER